jgi:uracil DNA glycosylase
MTLWKLQAAIVALMLLVGLAFSIAPQFKAAPKSLQKMCAGPNQDETARDLCAEFNAG